MISNHTKGEWIAKETKQNDRDKIFFETDVICGGIIVARVAGVGKESAEANARLIASAPELLKNIQLLLIQLRKGNITVFPERESTPDYFEKLQALIDRL